MTHHYELLNYSEHGTTVDNVLYSCDFSDKSSVAGSQTSSVVGSVRKLIRKGKNKEDAASALSLDKELMSSRTNEVCVNDFDFFSDSTERSGLHVVTKSPCIVNMF